MKALSVREPWATLVVLGLKPREYRGIRPPGLLPRRIAIHAAQALDTSAEARAAAEAAGLAIEQLPRGVILGEVTVTGWITTPENSPMRRYGRFAWTLAGPVRYVGQLTPALGQLGLWDIHRGIEKVRP